MSDRRLIATGVIGGALASICCATPLLVVALGAVGASAWVAEVDGVLIPVFVACLALVAFGVYRRHGRREKGAIEQSVITCPHCGTATTEVMPTDACRVRYECSKCGALLRPKPGDCCVFCSYGSAPCPPKQLEGARSQSSCC